jgi:plasmid replication initiation protein
MTKGAMIMSGKNTTVKKHVATIHINNKLTLLQRKFSNVLLLNAYDDLLLKKSHIIDIKTLCLMLNYNSKDIETLKDSLRGLTETSIEWNVLDEEGKEKSWEICTFLTYAKIENGICRYEYHERLAEKLYNPEIYANINLNIQRQFSSGYALALYENCYRFLNVGKTGLWSLETFKKLMGISKSEYYDKFKNLNQFIIKPSVKEINRTSNIIVEPLFKKTGRKITDIQFTVKENPALSLFDIEENEIRETEVFKRLNEKGISQRLAMQWIMTEGEQYIAEKLNYVDLLEKEGKIKSSYSGYLRTAIEKNYKDPKAENRKKAEERKIKRLEEEECKREEERAKKAKEEREAKEIQEYLTKLPKRKRQELITDFEEKIINGQGYTNKFLRDNYRKDAFESPMVAALYHIFVRDNYLRKGQGA